MTEINLDDIKHGDTIVVEGTAYVDGKFICLDNPVVRSAVYDETPGRLVGHSPKAIDEPTGTGAVVKVKWRDGGEYILVRITDYGDSVVRWNTEGHSVKYGWDVVLKQCSKIEVLFEGIKV